MGAFLDTEGDGDRAKADPGGEGAEEAAALFHGEEGGDDFTVEEFEVGGIGHINADGFGDDFVEGAGEKGM